MKKTRKIFLIITVVLALAVCFAFGVSAEEFTDGYYTYTVENGEATITAVDTSISGDVIIPDTLGGYPIVNIGDRAFEECFAITRISLPDSLVKIGYGAFAYCFNINEINFGKNLKTISEMSFLCCFSLTEIILPDSLEFIENSAFCTCYSLNKVSISENIRAIGCDAFASCVTLEEIYLYSNDVAIEEHGLGYDYYIIDTNKISKSNFAEKVRQAYSLSMKDMSDDALMSEFEKKVSELNNYYSYYDEGQVNIDTTIYSYIGSTAEAYAKENGIKFEEIKDTIKLTDEDTKVQVEYESTVFDGEPTLLISESIVDANYVFVSLFSKFAPYDISFEMNGEKVQPNGKVTVKIPLPENYNADTTFVYYVDDSGNYTKLDSTYADGYIIFETDHFSEYVLVDESSKIEQPSTEPDEPTTEPDDEPTTEPEAPADDDCGCACHNNGFMKFIYKIINFFRNIFGKGNCCECF